MKKNLKIIMAHPTVHKIDGLLCHWDLSKEDPFTSNGQFAYTLKAGHGDVDLVQEDDSLLKSALINEGQYLYIPRKDCKGLNISGKQAQVAILAWVKRAPKSYVQCEAIAGMWNETEKKRQYCLFLNLALFDSADQVCGHISGVGGPTPGNKWCVDASIGKNPVEYKQWCHVAFTYDGKQIVSFLNGNADLREGHNPYPYDQGIFDAGDDGSDFTVGAVHRLGEMGNFFVGQIAELSVFNRALSEEEIHAAFQDRASLYFNK